MSQRTPRHALGTQGALGPAGFSARTVGGQRPLSQRSLTAPPRPVPAGAACGAGLGPTSWPQGLRLPPPQFSLPFVFVSPSYVTPALGGALRPSGSHPAQGDPPRRWPGLLSASDAPLRAHAPEPCPRGSAALCWRSRPPGGPRCREADHFPRLGPSCPARSQRPCRAAAWGPWERAPPRGLLLLPDSGSEGLLSATLLRPVSVPLRRSRRAVVGGRSPPSHTRPGPRRPMGPSAPAAG